MKHMVYEPKHPTSKENYVGVEIEFLMTMSQTDKFAEALFKENLHYNVHFGYDNSVKDLEFIPKLNMYGDVINHKDKKYGKEIRVLGVEKELPELITKVCLLIEKHEGTINSTCGLHVHLDMRNRDVDLVFNNFFYAQKLLFATQPKMRKEGKYCKMLARNAPGKDKYYGVNRKPYETKRTLEIRMHEGTINAKEILSWVGLLIKIANLKEKLTSSVKDFTLIKVPEKIVGYFDARIKKFA